MSSMLSIHTEIWGFFVVIERATLVLLLTHLREEWVVIWESGFFLDITAGFADVEHRLDVWIYESDVSRTSVAHVRPTGDDDTNLSWQPYA